MANVIIGSARIDEKGGISGGKAGDQKQTAMPDYTGEVAFEKFYVHSKGWYIIRAKSIDVANRIAERMATACNNPCLGYDQSERLGVITYGIDTKTPTECDCSSLVRQCVKEASGIDPGNFNTSVEASALNKTGLFEPKIAYTNGAVLYTGDILVTKSQGHTAVVVQGTDRSGSTNTVVHTEKPLSPSKAETAKNFDKSFAGTYKVTASSLNLRSGAGTNKAVIAKMAKGAKVRCYGYYTKVGVKDWLFVAYNNLTGFCSKEYLEK